MNQIEAIYSQIVSDNLTGHGWLRTESSRCPDINHFGGNMLIVAKVNCKFLQKMPDSIIESLESLSLV